MTAPRPLNDGDLVGWGLLAFIVMISGMMALAAGSVVVRTWKRWLRT